MENEMSTKKKLTPAEQAVHHILGRLSKDPALAYYMAWGTESLTLLCKAHAHRVGIEDWESFYNGYAKRLKIQRPADCGDCDRGHCDDCNAGDCSKCTIERLNESNLQQMWLLYLLFDNSQGIIDSQGKLQTWNSIDPCGLIKKTVKSLANL